MNVLLRCDENERFFKASTKNVFPSDTVSDSSHVGVLKKLELLVRDKLHIP